jgi:hypothetical protein
MTKPKTYHEIAQAADLCMQTVAEHWKAEGLPEAALARPLVVMAAGILFRQFGAAGAAKVLGDFADTIGEAVTLKANDGPS